MSTLFQKIYHVEYEHCGNPECRIEKRFDETGRHNMIVVYLSEKCRESLDTYRSEEEKENEV